MHYIPLGDFTPDIFISEMDNLEDTFVQPEALPDDSESVE
jgi:hypothetical protein